MDNNMSNMNYFIIEYICIAYNEGRYADLKRMGVPHKIAAALAKLNMAQIAAIVKFRAPIFFIKANLDNFPYLLSHLDRSTQRETKIHDLIKRGATFTVIGELTGATRIEFNELCARVGVDPRCNSGKPRNLTDAEIRQQSDLLATMADRKVSPLDQFWTMVTQTSMPAGPVWRWLRTGGE